MTTIARRPAAAAGRHHVDNSPTIRITRGTLLHIVGTNVERHRAAPAGRWEESLVPPLLLIGFGLLLILTGAVWW